jgi:DNA-binding winged helix-turn-helix (wHTH) protein
MIFCFGDLELDEGCFELRRRGERVAVTPKVLQTLVHLVRHRHRLVTRDELFAGPWAGTVVTDAAIAQALKLARQALGDIDQKLIRTVRGKGVRFVGHVVEHADRPASGIAPRAPVSALRDLFVGRERELEVLRAAREGALDGAGRVVLIQGEAGVGKTALVERFADESQASGMGATWGRGWEAGGTPAFWPWLEALRDLVQSPGLSALGPPPDGATQWLDLAPELRKSAGFPEGDGELPVEPQHARSRLFDSMTRFLTWVSGTLDVLLIIEDLHTADGDSIALLHYLAPRIRSSRLLIVATLRPEGLSDGDPRTAAPQGTELISLGGLSGPEVEELVRASGLAAFGDAELAQIRALAAGNPLLVRELSAALATAGARTHVDEESVAGALGAVLRRRLGTLPPGTLRILEAAAILGCSFDLRSAARVADLDSREALAALQPAVDRRIVAPVSSPERAGAYQFGHALLRDAVEERLTPAQRCDVHARCAAVLEAEGPLDDEAVFRIARHHWLASPVHDRAPARVWALRAADRARRACAYDAKAEQLARAIELGTGDAAASIDRTDLLVRRGHALRFAGRIAEALSNFEEAASTSRALGDAARFADALIGRSETLGEGASIDVSLRETLREALTLPLDPERRASLLAAYAQTVFLECSTEEVASLLSEAADLAHEAAAPVTRARILLAGARVCADPRATAATATEIVEAGRQAGHPDILLRGHLTRYWGLVQLGTRAELDIEADRHARLTEATRHPWHSMWSEMIAALHLFLAGDGVGARDRARVAFQRGELLGEPTALLCLQSLLLSIAPVVEPSSPALFVELHEVSRHAVGLYPTYLLCQITGLVADFEVGHTEGLRDRFRAKVDVDLKGLRRDGNYLTKLGLAGYLAARLGETSHAASLCRELRPFAGCHVAHMIGYFGPVNYVLSLLEGARGDETAARAYLVEALADVQRMEVLPWIAKLKREVQLP